MAPKTIGQLLVERARTHSSSPFLIIDDTSLSFGGLHEAARCLALGMISLGLDVGDHVAVLMPNSIEAAIVFYATHLAGGVAVPINARFKRRELRHIITHSDARLLFTTQAIRDHVDFVSLVWDAVEGLSDAQCGTPMSLERAPELRRVIVSGGEAPSPAMDWSDVEAAASADCVEELSIRTKAGRAKDVAFLLYTSGTTALPKGCEITHEAVIGSWSDYADNIGIGEDAGIWSPCPFFHIGGLGPMTAALVKATPFLSMTHFEPGAANAMLLAHRPPHLFPAFPTLTLALLRSPQFEPAKFGFVRTVLNVSPPDTQRLVQDLLPEGAMLLNDFGMTEASGIVAMTRPEDRVEQRLGSNGRPMSGLEIKIVDPVSGRDAERGTTGEIYFRGINAFRGYYKDPEATSAAINQAGWVLTADLGQLDEAGCLHYVGRLKEIIKVGGENVAPAEVEAYLSTHPSVKMVQVIGRPDDRYGEVPIAFVELLEPNGTDASTLIDFCIGHMASYKIPRDVRFVTEWPMSATKIQKFRLHELLDDPSRSGAMPA